MADDANCVKLSPKAQLKENLKVPQSKGTKESQQSIH